MGTDEFGQGRDSAAPVAIITGATGGIGLWIARGIAQAGFHLVLVARDSARADAARQWIIAAAPSARIDVVLADLSLLGATRVLGVSLRARYPKIALLVNNAGIFDTDRVITSEARERVLATNLLSPVLLTQTLLPALAAGAPSRIVTTGSSTSDGARIDPEKLELGAQWSMRRAYAQSKLALMMATFFIADQIQDTGVVANVVHPGLVATGLVKAHGVVGLAWRLLAHFARTSEQGAAAPLFAALAPQMADVSRAYVKNRSIVAPNPRARDAVLVGRVWQATQALIAKTASV